MINQAERYHASMAGEFFVAAQLQRLQLDASITYGTAKRADILVFSRVSGKAIVVEVKTSVKGRWPVGNRVPGPSNNAWVFVQLPERNEVPPEYFVMTQRELHGELISM